MFSSGGKRTINDQMAPSLRQFPPSGAADQYTLSPTYWVICLPLSGFCDREQPIKYRLRGLGKQRVMVLKLYPQLHVPRNFIEIIGGALESL